MAFDYSKLKGRIIEKYDSQSSFADAMKWSERTLSLKLNGKLFWKQSDICKAVNLLGLSADDIQDYFFKEKFKTFNNERRSTIDDLVYLRNEEAVCDSLQVAKKFGKRHDKLISEIERMYSDLIGKGCAQNGGDPLFIKSSYVHPQNKQTYPFYIMNRDGFSLLVMGFTGKKPLNGNCNT